MILVYIIYFILCKKKTILTILGQNQKSSSSLEQIQSFIILVTFLTSSLVIKPSTLKLMIQGTTESRERNFVCSREKYPAKLLGPSPCGKLDLHRLD